MIPAEPCSLSPSANGHVRPSTGSDFSRVAWAPICCSGFPKRAIVLGWKLDPVPTIKPTATAPPQSGRYLRQLCLLLLLAGSNLTISGGRPVRLSRDLPRLNLIRRPILTAVADGSVTFNQVDCSTRCLLWECLESRRYFHRSEPRWSHHPALLAGWGAIRTSTQAL